MKKILSTVVMIAMLSATSIAHEYWFEPSSFFANVKEKIDLKLFLGEGLKVEEERPFEAAKTVSFRQYFGEIVFDAKNNVDKSMPFYSYWSGSEGNHMFALERNWSYITLEPDKFDEYLREDGMEYIIEERAKLGESQRPGRERYSRFIKTLLQIGEKRDNVFKKKTGMKLDITPLENPYSKKVGDELNFQVTFDGKPLANRTIFADNRDNDVISKQRLTTDSKGKVKVNLDRSGVWLVRLVFMQRCKTDCGEADWESFWGAFSFGVK